MTRSGQEEGGGRRRREGDGGTDAEFLDAQIEAMQKQLETYLDRRMEGIGGVARGGSAHAAGGLRGLWLRWRPEVYLLVVLVALAFLHLGGGEPSPGAEGTPETARAGAAAGPSPAPPEPAPDPATEPATLPEDPNAAWAGLVAERPAAFARWARAGEAAAGLPSNAVSDIQKGNFRTFAGLLEERGQLAPDQLELLRGGLFEYVYGLWMEQSTGSVPGSFRVNQQYEGYEADGVRSLLRELGLDGLELAPEALQDPPSGLRVLVLERWTERREPPAA